MNNPYTVNTDKVTEKRFIIINKTTGTGNTRSMEITLTNLSFNDSNLSFGYRFIDVNVKEHFGSNTLKVYRKYFIISMLGFITSINLSNSSHVSSKNICSVLY